MHLEVTLFQKLVLDYFAANGRVFPWRVDYNPYHVLVSEIMLQQTQTERVVPKFEAFIEEFPTVEALAAAGAGAVLKLWQGLGYNRRGLNLHRAAQQIVTMHGGRVPQTTEHLVALPGIGPYTAAAIQAFAFNLPSVVIETNIRAVYLHHYFPNTTEKISDKELIPLITETLDSTNPRRWYSALMDYGSFLKTHYPNPTRRSAHHVKQSKFEGSNRQVRGQVLKALVAHSSLSRSELESQLTQFNSVKLNEVTDQLLKEGMIIQDAGVLKLP